MRFAKYHGIGNDFVMLADPRDQIKLSPEIVKRLSDRRFGIGGDGVIRLAPAADADLFMDYYNSDGSIGEMCGNGIRCLAIFAIEEGLTSARELAVATRAGRMVVEVLPGDLVRVDMGAPVFAPEDIPMKLGIVPEGRQAQFEGRDALHANLEVGGEVVEAACLSMGNPHAVVFVEEPATVPVSTLGPAIENLGVFPNKTNVEFVRVESPESLRMRVWERGSGETLACGTGACAAAVAARLLAETKEQVTVSLPGGRLEIEWSGSLDEKAPVLMTGPVTKSFEGEVDLEAYS